MSVTVRIDVLQHENSVSRKTNEVMYGSLWTMMEDCVGQKGLWSVCGKGNLLVVSLFVKRCLMQPGLCSHRLGRSSPRGDGVSSGCTGRDSSLVSYRTSLESELSVCADCGYLLHENACCDALNWMYALKRKSLHFDEMFITGCTGSCQNDNFQCSQWWKFRQNDDIFVSVRIQERARP